MHSIFRLLFESLSMVSSDDPLVMFSESSRRHSKVEHLMGHYFPGAVRGDSAQPEHPYQQCFILQNFVKRNSYRYNQMHGTTHATSIKMNEDICARIF